MEDPRYRLAYDEALRSIAHQEATLDEMRSRAGLLLAALSVVTSFLGGSTIAAHGLGPMALLASVLFAGAGGILVSLLWPRKGWMFRFTPEEIIGVYVEADNPAEVNYMYRDLALHLGGNLSKNERRMSRLWRGFQWACALLVAEVLVWLLALAHL